MSDSSPPTRRLQVAIDGPAGAGKSTVARRVADALGYTYVDTGAMYRAVAWAVLEYGVDPNDPGAVGALADELDIRLEPGPRVFVGGTEITDLIRTPSISNLTSPLSAIPRVDRLGDGRLPFLPTRVRRVQRAPARALFR